MGTRTGNPTWQNSPSTATLITAPRLNAIETVLDASVAVADAVPLATATPLGGVQNGYAGTDAAAAHGLHQHPLPAVQPSITVRSGNWVTPDRLLSPAVYDIDRLWLAPYWLAVQDNRPIQITALGVNVTTAGSSNSTCEVGIYASQGYGFPDLTQKLVSATITTGATTGEKSVTLGSTYTFPSSPGLYWAAGIVHGTTSPQFTRNDTSFLWPRIHNLDASGMVQAKVYTKSAMSALPTTQITLSQGGEDVPCLFIKSA
jgi:hypothetical protein